MFVISFRLQLNLIFTNFFIKLFDIEKMNIGIRLSICQLAFVSQFAIYNTSVLSYDIYVIYFYMKRKDPVRQKLLKVVHISYVRGKAFALLWFLNLSDKFLNAVQS